jgi:hypothetical protein
MSHAVSIRTKRRPGSKVRVFCMVLPGLVSLFYIGAPKAREGPGRRGAAAGLQSTPHVEGGISGTDASCVEHGEAL